jgi:hypothetical protein
MSSVAAVRTRKRTGLRPGHREIAAPDFPPQALADIADLRHSLSAGLGKVAADRLKKADFGSVRAFIAAELCDLVIDLLKRLFRNDARVAGKVFRPAIQPILDATTASDEPIPGQLKLFAGRALFQRNTADAKVLDTILDLPTDTGRRSPDSGLRIDIAFQRTESR